MKHPNEDEDGSKFPFPSPPKKTKSPWGEWETEKEKEQRLKEEKEDQEFERQLNIQLKRRIRDNRDKNYSTDSFGSGKRRKSISEKEQDLLEDTYYPECIASQKEYEKFQVEKRPEETQQKLAKMTEDKKSAVKLLKELYEGLNDILPHIQKMAEEKKMNDKQTEWIQELL